MTSLFCIETYRGTATGWTFAGSRNYHSKQRAERLLALHRRIDPDRYIYRLTQDVIDSSELANLFT